MSFVNHKTNLSVFKSQLQTICREIIAAPSSSSSKSSQHPDGSGSNNNNNHNTDSPSSTRQAQDFLNQQKSRVVQVERNLLRVTHEILPGDDDTSLSMTELARAMADLQRIYMQHLTAAQEVYDPFFKQQMHQQREQEESEQQRTPVPQHWTVGRILTAVPETDHETDTSVVTTGKSTKSNASSIFFKSPADPSSSKTTTSPWASQRRRHIVPTPQPRAIPENSQGEHDPFDDQQSTASSFDNNRHSHRQELHNDILSVASETLLLWPDLPGSPQLSHSTLSILSSQQSTHENDTLDRTDRSSGQRRVDAFADLEQRLRHGGRRHDSHRHLPTNSVAAAQVARNSPIDTPEEEEDETIETITPTVVATRSELHSVHPSHASLDPTMEEDSAQYCATVVQQSRTPLPLRHRRHAPHRRPSYIEFDPKSTASPAMSSVNMTMDNDLDETIQDLTTYLDTAMGGLDTVPETSMDERRASISSTETPVLDRYRLDVDEKVPGGLVVRPNPRHQHRRRAVVKLPPLPQRKSPEKGVFRRFIADENAPANFASSVQTHSNTQRQPASPRVPLAASLDGTAQPTSGSRQNDRLASSTYSDAEMAGMSPHHIRHHTKTRNASMISPRHQLQQLEIASAPSTTTERLHHSMNGTMLLHTPPLKSLADRRATLQTWTASPTRATPADSIPRQRIMIAPITKAEYEASPRVVTMQVSLPQVHEAVLRLNTAWRSDPTLSTALTESQIKAIWSNTTDRQRTKLLLSLCHWRRMEAKQSTTSPRETVYAVIAPKAVV